MKNLKRWGMGIIAYFLCIGGVMSNTEASTLTAGKAHIGTFNGSTTFRTSSSNGINPGLFIEVRDAAGNLKQYTSDDGVVTVKNTKEGAYVTQAKLLGKTKYVDQETGEVLDQWEAGRNLKLESSKMPVLTTTGKNLVDNSKNSFLEIDFDSGAEVEITNKKTHIVTDYIKVYKGESFSFSIYNSDGTISDEIISYRVYDLKKNYLGSDINVIKNTGGYVRLRCLKKDELSFNTINDIVFQAEVGNKTAYEPYKSNILTVNEEVELRGIGDVKDELNLLTGELTQRICEIVLDGNEAWILPEINENTIRCYANDIMDTAKDRILYNDKGLKVVIQSVQGSIDEESISIRDSLKGIGLRLSKTKATTVNELKSYLSQNPITIQYQLATESIKTVDLTTTHQFDVISDAFVQVKGDVLPTIYSVTVPSEPLTFAINPNGEEGQQFIAPDFKITNESKGPVFLELKSFQQVTNVFNDVSPDKYENWSYLTKDESRDIALALVPMKSEGWLTLNEGLKYVSTTENIELGSIKPGGTVDFSFSAYHGRVFDQNLFPEYRLVFTFGF